MTAKRLMALNWELFLEILFIGCLTCIFFLPFPARAEETAEITIHSIPDNADVIINGVDRGKTPLLVVLPVGSSLKIKLSHSDARPYVLDYDVKKDDTIIVDLSAQELVDEHEYWRRIAKKTVVEVPTATPTPAQSNQAASDTIPMVEAKVLEIPKPGVVPEELVNEKTAGSAVYIVRINHRGQVIETKPVQPSPTKPLDDFIIQWIDQWRFAPAEAGGFPVPSEKRITIYFDLQKKLLKIQDFPEPNVFSPEASASKKPDLQTSTVSESKPPKEELKELSIEEVTPESTEEEKTPVPEATKVPTATPTPVATDVSADKNVSTCNDVSAVDKKPAILQPPTISAIPIDIQNLKLKGSAVFELFIKTDGKVDKVLAVESTGSDKLDKWLISILMTTEWYPAMLNGETVPCRRRVAVSYYTLACRFDFPDLYE